MKFTSIILLAATALAARVHVRQDVPVPAPAPEPVPAPVPAPAPVPSVPSVPAPVPPGTVPPAVDPPVPAPAPSVPANPPTPEQPAPAPDPIPVPASPEPPVPAPSGAPFDGPNCGKGFTYCGYMLEAGGHNFAPEQISQAYCDGLGDHCLGNPATASKTNVTQAVFYCLDDAPNSSIELLCACSTTCENDPLTNNIAHCKDACWN